MVVREVCPSGIKITWPLYYSSQKEKNDVLFKMVNLLYYVRRKLSRAWKNCIVDKVQSLSSISKKTGENCRCAA